MHPVLFVLDWGPEPRALGSFGACMALAILVTAASSLRACVREGMDPGAVIAALGLAVVGGFVGAYATFVAVSVVQGEALMHALLHPGLVFYGGALGALAAFALGARTLRVPVLPALDALTPALPLGHALGRLGCFLGGCCYGAETHVPWSVTYTHALAPAAQLAVARHPWPLYEGAALVLLSIVLSRRPVDARGMRAGVRFATYVAAYGCIRLVLEPLRGDPVRGLFFEGHVSTSQLWALASTTLALAYVFAGARGTRRMAIVAALLASASWMAVRPALADRTERLSVRLPDKLRVAAGAFSMGSDDAAIAAAVALCARELPADACAAATFADERPAHEARVGTFLIDRTEVSHGAYRRCAAAGVCAPLELSLADEASALDELPVTRVTWHEAGQYCRFVTGRLPTEAEWERAARGGSTRRFPWGNVWSPKLANHGSAKGEPLAVDGHAQAAPVEAFPDGRSPYGLLQMAGNVWEWVSDRHAGPRTSAPAAPGDAVADEHVVRGGSFLSPPHQLRATSRGHLAADQRRPDVGFRCAYDVR